MRNRRGALDGLTYKQQRFVQEFVRHGNLTAAATTAGYSPNCAQQIGSENLLKPVIQEAIRIEREHMRQAARTTREELLAEMLTIALGDMGDVVSITKKGVRIKSTKEMGHARRMISSVSETPGEYGKARKVTFYDKQRALNDVWEKLGFGTLDPQRDRDAFSNAISTALGRVKARK